MKLLEKHIQATCTAFLEQDGWRALRTDPVSDVATMNAIRRAVAALPIPSVIREMVVRVVSKCVRGKGFGELGMADHLYIRYRDPRKMAGASQDFKLWHRSTPELIWIEWKRERGGTGKRGLFTKAEKAKIHQKAWHAAERARGALTLIAGEDFQATIEGFVRWYGESGLQRREMTLGTLTREGRVASA